MIAAIASLGSMLIIVVIVLGLRKPKNQRGSVLLYIMPDANRACPVCGSVGTSKLYTTPVTGTRKTTTTFTEVKESVVVGYDTFFQCEICNKRSSGSRSHLALSAPAALEAVGR
jgi:hypothetical protein